MAGPAVPIRLMRSTGKTDRPLGSGTLFAGWHSSVVAACD